MKDFIETYLADKNQALRAAREEAAKMRWCDSMDDEMIYAQLASPEFRLYQEIVFSEDREKSQRASLCF